MVNKFKNHVSPNCKYCNSELETILHLCDRVNRFWDGLTDFFIDNNIFIPLERNKILFGIHNEPPDSVSNFVILCAKQYIWNNKFFEPLAPLSLGAFINILITKVHERKNVSEMLKNYNLYYNGPIC